MTAVKVLTVHGDQRVEQLAMFARVADTTGWTDVWIRPVEGNFEIWATKIDGPATSPAPLELVAPPPPEPAGRPEVETVDCECGAGHFRVPIGIKLHRKSSGHMRWKRGQDAQRAVATLEAPPATPLDYDGDDDRDEPSAHGGLLRCDEAGCGRMFSRPNGLNRHRSYAHPPNKGDNSGPIATNGPRVGEAQDDWQQRRRRAAAAAL